MRFKSDNCSTQYKGMNVFPKWRQLAIAYQKVIMVYYGVGGHRKGLVDAMSSFGAEGPRRKATVERFLL